MARAYDLLIRAAVEPAGVTHARDVMPLAEQLATIAPYLAAAVEAIAPSDVDHDALTRLAVERFVGTGATEHGDALYRKTVDELVFEEMCEHADAAVYRARRMSLTHPQTADLVGSLFDHTDAKRHRTELATGVSVRPTGHHAQRDECAEAPTSKERDA